MDGRSLEKAYQIGSCQLMGGPVGQEARFRGNWLGAVKQIPGDADSMED